MTDDILLMKILKTLLLRPFHAINKILESKYLTFS